MIATYKKQLKKFIFHENNWSFALSVYYNRQHSL